MANKFVSKQILNYIMKNGHTRGALFAYLTADDFAKFLSHDEHLYLIKELDSDSLIEFTNKFCHHGYPDLEDKFRVDDIIYYLSDDDNKTLVTIAENCPEIFYSNMYKFVDSYEHIIRLLNYETAITILQHADSNQSTFISYLDDNVLERILLENRDLLGGTDYVITYLDVIKDVEARKNVLRELHLNYVYRELPDRLRTINDEDFIIEIVNKIETTPYSLVNLLINLNDIVTLDSYDSIKHILNNEMHPNRYFFSYGYTMKTYDAYHKFLSDFPGHHNNYSEYINKFDSDIVKRIIYKYNESGFITAALKNNAVELDNELIQFLLKNNQRTLIDYVGVKKKNELGSIFTDDVLFELIRYHGNLAFTLFEEEELTPEFINKLSGINPSILYELFKRTGDTNTFKDSLYKLGFDNFNYFDIQDNPEQLEVLYEFLKSGDIPEDKFVNIFKKLVRSDNDRILRYIIERAAKYNNQSVDDFMTKFIKLKSTNVNLLDSLDYRLFNQRFSFLNEKQVEMLSVHSEVFDELAKSSDKELTVIGKLLNNYNDLNWINLLDRILLFKNNYKSLINNIDVDSLNEDRLNKLVFLLTRNVRLDINTIDDLDLVDSKLNELINKEANLKSVESVRDAIFLKLIGLTSGEVKRLYDVYCNDLDNIKESKEFNEDLKEMLIFIHKVFNIKDVNTLKAIFREVKQVGLDNTFCIDLESEIKRNFLKEYNSSLYHIKEEDYIDRLSYEGMNIPVYACGGKDGSQDFGLMISSLGAYTPGYSPNDFYADWNTDLIQSHGFCCSYLQNDNLGTATIKYAVLGFTDFAPDALLLAGPYDLVSKYANVKFNVTKEQDNNKFYSPRGMVDNTRHTHNEMVFERRDLDPNAKEFKKAPSYVIFFCDDYANLNPSEKEILEWTKMCAYQMGMGSRGEPLPIVLVDRKKISAKQSEIIQGMLDKVCSDAYIPGDISKLIVKLYNNQSGCREYHENINQEYFAGPVETNLIERLTNHIFGLLAQNRFDDIQAISDDLSAVVSSEIEKCGTSKKEFNSQRYENIINLCTCSLIIRDVPELHYLTSLLNSLGGLVASPEGYDSRYNQTGISSDTMIKPEEIMTMLTYNKDRLNTFIKKVKELEVLDIYKKDTRYDNRNIVNKMFYALIYCNNAGAHINFEELLNLIMYERCSYMDGEDKENLDSSIEKMIRLNPDKKPELLKQIGHLLVINNPSMTDEELKSKFEQFGFHDRFAMTSSYSYDANSFRTILSDVNALEYARYVKGAPFDINQIKDENMKKLAKLSFELQESYATKDIEAYVSEHPEYEKSVNKALETLTPQEIIRLIRKGRFELTEEVQQVDFDDAIKFVGDEATMDPLGIIDSKMRAYGELPPQVSVEEMLAVVNSTNFYDYLVELVKTGDDLYLDRSKIHGVTHASNVSLISLYLAGKNGLGEQDIKTLLEASVYHDIGRTKDDGDRGHGINGANKYVQMVGEKEGLSKDEVSLLIEAHALPGNTNSDEFSNQLSALIVKYGISKDRVDNVVKMATIIRDADALDRTRFRLTDANVNNLRTEYLFDPNSFGVIRAIQQLNNIIYRDYIAEMSKKPTLEGDNHGRE